MKIENIEVAVVFNNGVVDIYGPQQNGVRPFVRSQQFSSYGKALQFAHEFEQRQLARQ